MGVLVDSRRVDGARGNRILSLLPAEDYLRLISRCDEVSFSRGDIFHRPGEPIQYAYFPIFGAVSIVAEMRNGGLVEVRAVGREGLVGIAALLGARFSNRRALVQIPGRAVRMQARELRAELERGGAISTALLRYAHAVLEQTEQLVACNRVHSVEARLIRWLLTMRDSVAQDYLTVTHGSIAAMLGARRATVCAAAAALQRRGSIRQLRGSIQILDRPALERGACECYSAIRAEFEQLIPPLM